MSPHGVTRDFEILLGEYTGAPYVVAVNSCSMAITIAVAYELQRERALAMESDRLLSFPDRPPVEIPKRTYVSVPMAIIHAGGRPTFRDERWFGHYRLDPLPVYDSARWFTQSLFLGIAPGRLGFACESFRRFVCVSFHASKTLGIEQGGAILHNDPAADEWLRRARFDGRTAGVPPSQDTFTQVGWHAYMNPSTAAQGILRLHSLPRHNAPLPNDDYPDLSTMEIFK